MGEEYKEDSLFVEKNAFLILLKFTEFWGRGAKLTLNTVKNYRPKIINFLFKSCFN